jgi:hypothetical protein
MLPPSSTVGVSRVLSGPCVYSTSSGGQLVVRANRYGIECFWYTCATGVWHSIFACWLQSHPSTDPVLYQLVLLLSWGNPYYGNLPLILASYLYLVVVVAL